MTDRIVGKIITNGTISQAEADKQMAEVRRIMAEREINYGPALDIYIKRQQNKSSGMVGTNPTTDNWPE